jgi:hypothetical protein
VLCNRLPGLLSTGHVARNMEATLWLRMVDVGLTIRLAPPASPIFGAMPPRRRTSKDTPAKLASRMRRRWRVVLLRSKGQVLGEVEAPDAEAAVAAAACRLRYAASSPPILFCLTANRRRLRILELQPVVERPER